MSGKIDTNQVTFTVQAVEIAPTFHSLRNFGGSDVNYVFASEQRIDGSSFVCLITVAITHQCFQE